MSKLIGALAIFLIVGQAEAPIGIQTLPVFTVKQKPVVAAPVLVGNYAVPVLMYHRIDDLTPEQSKNALMRDLTVSPANFEQQIAYLKANNFTALTVDQIQEALLGGKPLPARSVVITMDDGYADTFDRAFPILRRYDFPATLFLITSMMTAENHVSWPDVDTMKRAGFTYGSHTVTHPDLRTLSLSSLDIELRDSKRVLEDHFRSPIESIAYPSGECNDLVVERTRAAGYLTAWTKGGGPVQPGDDPYRLPRVRVRGSTTMEDFKRMVWSGPYARKYAARRPRHLRRSA